MHSNSQSGNPLLCFCAIPHNLTTSDLIPNEFNPCLSILFYFVSSLFHFVPYCAALPHNLTPHGHNERPINCFSNEYTIYCFFRKGQFSTLYDRIRDSQSKRRFFSYHLPYNWSHVAVFLISYYIT